MVLIEELDEVCGHAVSTDEKIKINMNEEKKAANIEEIPKKKKKQKKKNVKREEISEDVTNIEQNKVNTSSYNENSNTDVNNDENNNGNLLGEKKCEKKVKAALAKLCLKKIDDIISVRLTRNNKVYEISKVEVYKCSNETYIIFGYFGENDTSNIKQPEEISKSTDSSFDFFKREPIATVRAPPLPLVPDCLPENVSMDDVALVCKQIGCTEREAINALVRNNGDIIEAIISL